MNEETKEREDSIELFGDPGIATFDAKVPKFLLVTYFTLPFWGFICFYYFWNGSLGWWDRGALQQLQIAANTTFPIQNQNWRQEVEEAHDTLTPNFNRNGNEIESEINNSHD